MSLVRSIKYAAGYIEVNVSGTRVPEEFFKVNVEIWEEIISLAERSGTEKVLYQSCVTGERPLQLTHDVLDEFINRHLAHLTVAYVEQDPQGFEDAKLLRTLLQMYDVKFELFQEVEPAIEWLEKQGG